jgi:hypothetical protein
MAGDSSNRRPVRNNPAQIQGKLKEQMKGKPSAPRLSNWQSWRALAPEQLAMLKKDLLAAYVPARGAKRQLACAKTAFETS